MALALAAELDDKDAPRYARPRVAAELRAVLLELDDHYCEQPRVDRPGEVALARVL